MSSSVVAFCETHNLTSMRNLLRHCDGAWEVSALHVLEELVANDAEKLAALQAIRAEIHPVAKAARFRATMQKWQAEMATAKELEREFSDRLAEMRRQLKRARKPAVDSESTQMMRSSPEHESQAFEYESTIPRDV
jgi:predicted  nucleic acid-binding Zn-ribbon protein